MTTTTLTGARKEPPQVLSALKAAPTQAADWVINEFAQAALPDQRLQRRLELMVTAFAQKPSAPIPEACPDWAEAKAAYRFLANERIVSGSLRQAHHQATLQRIKERRVVLAIQDTTALNYSTHPKTKGLGPLGSHSPKVIGLLLSVDLVVAWRVLALCKAARQTPDDPVSHWLPQAQWQALCCYAQQRTIPPKTAPGVRQAVRWLAQMGGFLGRKSDGEPGPQTLWRGLRQLEAITDMWQLFHEKERSQKCG